MNWPVPFNRFTGSFGHGFGHGPFDICAHCQDGIHKDRLREKFKHLSNDGMMWTHLWGEKCLFGSTVATPSRIAVVADEEPA